LTAIDHFKPFLGGQCLCVVDLPLPPTILPLQVPLYQLIRLLGRRTQVLLRLIPVIITNQFVQCAYYAFGADLSLDALLNGVTDTLEHQHVGDGDHETQDVEHACLQVHRHQDGVRRTKDDLQDRVGEVGNHELADETEVDAGLTIGSGDILRILSCHLSLVFPKQGPIVLCLLLVHIDVASYQQGLDDDTFDGIDHIVNDIFLVFFLFGTQRLPEDGEFQVSKDSTLEEIGHQADIPVGFHPFGQEGEDVKDECGILHTIGEMSQNLLRGY
jgi:hypothetical protein